MKRIILLASILTVLLASCTQDSKVKISRVTTGVSYEVSASNWDKPLKKGELVFYASDFFTVDSVGVQVIDINND